MRIIFIITFIILSFGIFSQTTGYVLTNADGTIRINDSAISATQIKGLNQFMAGKMKTINNQSIFGATGNISVNNSAWGSLTGTLSDQTDLQTALNGKQALSSILTSIGGLANVSGFLKNNGSGVFTYENPAGSGTVTDVSVVSANGISGSVATSTSTPAITLSLGAITPTTVNGVTITDLLPKTTTAGVSASPTASGTTTVTHSLGRVPNIIRIYGMGTFTASTSATPTPFSMGIWNSSGNRCIYMTTAGTTTQASQTSTVFAVFIATTSGNNISGVIQNVTSTSFDILWTETGTATAQNFLWEAQ